MRASLRDPAGTEPGYPARLYTLEGKNQLYN